MPRETAYAREVRAEIAEMFGDKRILSIGDVIKYTGKSRNWVNKHIPFVDGYISVVKFCNILG